MDVYYMVCQAASENKDFPLADMQDKVQSADQLARKNWAGPTDCKLCGHFESTEHIFT
jgi:hypothetical protein